MPVLLQLNTSPLTNSVSRELTSEFVKSWKEANPNGAVIDRDLAAAPPPPIDATWVAASYAPESARTAEQTQALGLSEQLIGELQAADTYVIGVAMHNFGIPSVLKLWLDQIARRGRTFSYEASGPKGLLQDKKAVVLIASGGVYEPGTPAGAFNFVEPYLKTVLGFLGVTNSTFITASGVAQLQRGGMDRNTFLKPTIAAVRAIAA